MDFKKAFFVIIAIVIIGITIKSIAIPIYSKAPVQINRLETQDYSPNGD